jgi:hypothetical protein
MTWRLYSRIFVKQFTTFSNVNCNKFPEICLQEFRLVSQQRVDILNIFYDGEYNISYCIWLIIKESSKQLVLAVPAARQHFPRQVATGFRRKLPSVESRSNQPALWTSYIYIYASRQLEIVYRRLWKLKHDSQSPVAPKIPGPLKDLKHVAYRRSPLSDVSRVTPLLRTMLFQWPHKSAPQVGRKEFGDSGGHASSYASLCL